MVNFLNFQTKSISQAAFILALASFFSAILGILRDRLLAGKFGAGNELDIYYAAFRIPDFICQVLIMGAISAAILPIFSQYWLRSKREAWQYLNSLLNLFLIFLIIISLILVIFTPSLIKLVAPGFSGQKRELTILLSRIMFLSPIFLGISNILSAILRFFQRFFVASLAPLVYNLGIIFGILILVPKIGLFGLAWGVVLGAFFHLLIQIPIFFSLGFRFQKILDFKQPGILKTLKLTLPRSLGIAANQINLIVITALASTLTSGSIASFNLANNLQNLPLNFIALSFSLAAFPFLVKSIASKNRERFFRQFSQVFSQILYLIIPISVLMFFLREQIVSLILKTGKFGLIETKITAACLGFFSFGLFALSLSPLISKTFYALLNTKTPAMVSLISIIFNISLCFLFLWLFSFENLFQKIIINFLDLENLKNISVIAFPLALSISGLFQFFLLFSFLKKKISLKLNEIKNSLKKILFSSFLMAISVYFVLKISAIFLNLQTFWGIFFQLILASFAGFLIYFLSTLSLKSPELKSLKGLRRIEIRKKIKS